ncbi:hypothetical protein H0H92_008067 [Tricholoma furcatifolium]|nr:hypothetical protein H0H92_008067 [Tricholoma furcatifolium]
MDQYFRMERAQEEIERLNIEIRRVFTHMRDEETFLRIREKEVEDSDVALAFQVHRYREERTRFYEVHRHRFKKLAGHQRFSGVLEPGVPQDKSLLLTLPGDTEDHDEDMNDAGLSHENSGEDGSNDGEEDGEEDLEDREREITDALQLMFIHG